MINNKMPVLGQKYRVVSYPHKEKVVITMSDFIYFDDGSHIIPEYFWNVFEEMQIGAKLRSGTVAFGELIEPSKENKSEEEKPKSIWKPAYQPPKEIEHLFIRWDDGEVLLGKYDPNAEEHGIKGQWYNLSKARESALNKNRIKYWVTLTDFINHIDSLEQRIKKLEGK